MLDHCEGHGMNYMTDTISDLSGREPWLNCCVVSVGGI